MNKYTYTLTPGGYPLFLIYTWIGSDNSDINYMIDSIVPDLTVEGTDYTAQIVFYEDIGEYIPNLKIQGFLPDAYVRSGYVKSEDVTYMPYSEQVLAMIRSNIQPVPDFMRVRAPKASLLFQDYVDVLGNKYERPKAETVEEQAAEVEEQAAEVEERQVTIVPEAVEFGGSYEVHEEVVETKKNVFEGKGEHPESTLIGRSVDVVGTELYDNMERNRPIGQIPSIMPIDTEQRTVQEVRGGQIPMVMPPVGEGKVAASIEIADVSGLIPKQFPVGV